MLLLPRFARRVGQRGVLRSDSQIAHKVGKRALQTTFNTPPRWEMSTKTIESSVTRLFY